MRSRLQLFRCSSGQSYLQSIANELDFPTDALINGKFTAAIDGATMQTINPATGASIADIAACGAKDVAVAVTWGAGGFRSRRLVKNASRRRT